MQPEQVNDSCDQTNSTPQDLPQSMSHQLPPLPSPDLESLSRKQRNQFDQLQRALRRAVPDQSDPLDLLANPVNEAPKDPKEILANAENKAKQALADLKAAQVNVVQLEILELLANLDLSALQDLRDQLLKSGSKSN